jgi:glycosyltransferase involved in cell wall biosynthesis
MRDTTLAAVPLRIAIDIRRIRDFGIGTYIRNLVRALAQLDHSSHYTLITRGEDLPELEGLPANFERAVFRRPDQDNLSELTYPIFLRNLSVDVYHAPVNVLPWAMPKPYVLTIHDMGSVLFPAKRGFRETLHLHRFLRGLQRAGRVITVSNATRRDVERVMDIPHERLRTIYNAPDPLFSEPPRSVVECVEDQAVRAPPDMQRILDRYQIDYPFLLYVGRTNPQKNIPRLVEAFAVLRGEFAQDPMYRDLRLIIIGDEISKYPSVRHAVVQSRVEQNVRFLGFVPIETLKVFYQAAAAFVFPSLYEGFGLPPLEAMACGTPVVTSNVSSLPEVVGDAAAVVNPENVFDIARGIREILLDRELRVRLIQKGFVQLQRYSWSETAAQVLDTYREVAGGKRSAP